MSESPKDVIRSYIIRTAQIEKLEDNEEIVAGNYLDSMGFIRMGAWLEEQFKIHIGSEDFTEENFSTLASIVRFVDSKRRG